MPRPMLRWLLAALLAVASFGVAACGDDDNGGSGSSSSGDFAPKGPSDGQKKGGHLTVIAADDVDSLDTGQAYYAFSYMILSATSRQLYTFQPTSVGDEVTPDLAEGEPEVSEDGKTVTVKIKKGIRYSPPYGKEVKAADFKYAIERAFTKQVPNGYANTYFSVIEGVKPFQDGEADEISGITTPDDNTLQIKTTGGDIVGAMVLPITAPVPKEYAEKFDKAKGQSTYAQNQLYTGPYMVRKYEPAKTIELVRNPNWDADTDYRPAYLDSITVDEGNADPTVATRRIVNGKAMISGDFAAPPEQLKQIATGPKKDQLTLAPGAGVRFMGLNTTIKPFDNVNVRKAIAAALDRRAMLQVRGGQFVGEVATHMIYPTTQGFDEAGGREAGADFYEKPEGDLALAAEYMKKAGFKSGKYEGDETFLMVGVRDGPPQRNAEIAQRALESLGFKLNFRLVSIDSMYTKFCQVPKAKVAVCPNLGWIKDYADARTIIDPLFNPKSVTPAGNVNFGQYSDPEFQKQMDEAVATPSGPERVKRFAELDKRISNELVLGVPWLWDRFPVTRSADVVPVHQQWNQGSADLAHTSLK